MKWKEGRVEICGMKRGKRDWGMGRIGRRDDDETIEGDLDN